MSPTPTPWAPESWLTCPATPEQTDAYWQAVTPWRAHGIELVLHPITDSTPLPWGRLQDQGLWRGLVLWPGALSLGLWQQAGAHGVQVRRFTPDPRFGLQPWSGDWPSGQSRM